MTESDFDTRTGAYAVIVDEPGPEQRILLALWNEPAEPLWSMPGGGVEPGETTEQAAVREVLEETGYHIVLAGLLGEHTHLVPAERRLITTDRPLLSRRVIYRGHIIGGSLRKEVGGTTDEARWIRLADVATAPRVDLVDAAIDLWRTVGG